MIEVTLQYKRVNGNKSSGVITLAGASSGVSMLDTFDEIEFSTMLYKFSQSLQDYPDAQAVIQRTDRDGLVPYNLDAQTANLFRTDPVAAVASMSTDYGSPSQAITRVKKQVALEPSVLRVGYDTLADSFGDEVYARLDEDKGRVECPCCGIWNPFLGEFVCRNPKCAQPLELEVTGKWAAFPTSMLLATHSARFYLPRAWNDYKPWITWGALNEKYNQFQKEKMSCP